MLRRCVADGQCNARTPTLRTRTNGKSNSIWPWLRQKTKGLILVYLGIDPGITGAWAALDTHGDFVACGDIPTMDGRVVASALKESILATINPVDGACIVIEQVHAMPGQGVTSMFNFGHSCGVVAAVADMLPYPVSFVTPQRWKKHHGLIGTKKADSLKKARVMWPDAPLKLAKHHGRSEALLIAAYWFGVMR